MAITQAMPIGADAPITVRQIHMSDLRAALSEGWRDFDDKRGDIVVVGFLYPLIGLMVAALALNDRFVPLAFPLCAGLSLLGPAVAVGFYELARRRESGEDSNWSHFLDPFRRNGAAILCATVVLALILVLWLGVAWLLYTSVFGEGDLKWSSSHLNAVTLSDFLSHLFTTREGWALVLFGNLVGAGFAIVVLALSVVSFPMLVDRQVDVATAFGVSLRAFAANWQCLLGWGVIVGTLLVLATIPVFIGLAVALPVLGYATWHLYTLLIPR